MSLAREEKDRIDSTVTHTFRRFQVS